MEKKIYSIDSLAKGVPYSHAVEVGGLIFISGTLPVDIEKKLAIKDDVTKATELVLSNIDKILEAAGSTLGKVVKATVFLRSMADFNAMNETYKKYFPENPPARSCVAVKEIPGDYPIEIEVIATK